MAKISGVSVELITKLGGVSKQLVRKLGGKFTAELGFGPDYNAGPTCSSWQFRYDANSLANAAVATKTYWVDWNRTNNIFYEEGLCGSGDSKAVPGYYVFIDARESFYFYWDGGSLTILEAPPAGYPLVDFDNITFSYWFATNGYPLSGIIMNSTVARQANAENKFYIYKTYKSVDSGATWALELDYYPDFEVDKGGNPIGQIASNATIGIIQGPQPGGPPTESLFHDEWYKVVGYPIFSDYSSYVEIIVSSGYSDVPPRVISYQSYLEGTPYF